MDDAWLTLKDIILSSADIAIPRVSHVKRVDGVPLSGSVRWAFVHRKKVFQDLRGFNSALAHELREKANDDLQEIIMNARKKFELSIVDQCKTNPKRF